jgi:hypothetical protein
MTYEESVKAKVPVFLIGKDWDKIINMGEYGLTEETSDEFREEIIRIVKEIKRQLDGGRP